METTGAVWWPVIVSLLFWFTIIAGVSYFVAKAVVRHELRRHTFAGTEPERRRDEPRIEEPSPTDREERF